MLLQARGINKSYNGLQVLKGISFDINNGEKVALIGPNGGGKTTLLRILVGRDQDFQGSLYYPTKTPVFYLPQTFHFPGDTTVKEVLLQENMHIMELKRRMEEMESNLDNQEKIRVYGELMTEFEARGGYSLEARLKEICQRFLWGDEVLHLPFDSLSGGEKTRVFLAQGFLQEASFMILDEPTNHLDIKALEWLEQVINSFPGTILYVSHDRAFMDGTAHKILELDRGEMKEYPGGYHKYKEQKELELETQWRIYEKERKEKKKLKELAEQKMSWFHIAHKAAGKSDSARRLAKKVARSAKAHLCRLNRLEEGRTEKPYVKKPLKMEIDSGKKGVSIAFLQNVSIWRGRRLIVKDLTLHLERGDKLAVIGPNGSGKSTLLRLLCGEKLKIQGEVHLSPGLKIGYLQQELENIEESISPVEDLMQEGVEQKEAWTILASLGLRGEESIKKMRYLSPGQRLRAVMARFVASPPDFLILDEPTNYLDIETRESLEMALFEYRGTGIYSCHDRYFLRGLASKVVDLQNPHKPVVFPGEYRHYEENRSFSEADLIKDMRFAEITARLGQENLSPEEKEYWEGRYRDLSKE